MREDTDGPPGYAVIGPEDYLAPALTGGEHLEAIIQRIHAAARARLGSSPIGYVGIRMRSGRPTGVVDHLFEAKAKAQ